MAVLSVVFFHNEHPWAAGGFVGVDVFFVVSGFLIGGILIREREETGRVDLPSFYARRIRRLLPLSLLVTTIVAVASQLVLSPLDAKEVRLDALAANLLSANVRFAADGIDYLAADQVASPLEHFWSLGVEEQFYLVFPVLVAVASVRILGLIVGVLSLVSATLATIGPDGGAAWEFFGLHTRAWELLAGVMLALLWPHVATLSTRWRTGVAVAGFAVVVATFVAVDTTADWPGGWTFAPVLGTVSILVGRADRGINALLGVAPLVWIGSRSYAWYLLHFPPIVLLPEALDRDLGEVELIGLAALTLLASDLVHRSVERPIRSHGSLARSARASITVGAVAVCTTLVVVAALAVTAPELEGDRPAEALTGPVAPVDLETAASVAFVPSNLVPPLDRARDDRPAIYDSGCHVDVDRVEPGGCVFGDASAAFEVALVGDSHAAQWFPTLDRAATSGGFRLTVDTKSGCPPFGVAMTNALLDRPYTECAQWGRMVIDRMTSAPPDLIVVSFSGTHRSKFPGDDPEWVDVISNALSEMASGGARVVVVASTPRPQVDVPACLAERLTSPDACSFERSSSLPGAAFETRAASAAGVERIELTDQICGPTRCAPIIGNVLVYRDGSHLTTVFARGLVHDFAASVRLPR